MAYQPLYARVSDSAGRYGHTSCLRGRVDEVGFWLNSYYGEVLNIYASLTEGKEIVPRPKLTNPSHVKKAERERVKAENERLLKEYEQKCAEASSVVVNITPHRPSGSARFIFRLAGIEFTQADLALLDKYAQKDFLGKLSVASAFALIPDIAKLVDDPSEANKTAFVSKRDNIADFIRSEEERICPSAPTKRAREIVKALKETPLIGDSPELRKLIDELQGIIGVS